MPQKTKEPQRTKYATEVTAFSLSGETLLLIGGQAVPICFFFIFQSLDIVKRPDFPMVNQENDEVADHEECSSLSTDITYSNVADRAFNRLTLCFSTCVSL